jgi:hypothetical protein
VPVQQNDENMMLLPVYMRERKVTQGYNGYQKVSQILFGQPLLIAIPKTGVTYDVLYNNILDKMV